MAFYADSKLYNSLGLMFPIKSNESEKICLIFKNGGITPQREAIIIKTTMSYSEYQKTLLSTKYPLNKSFFFCHKKDHGYVFIIIFFRVDHYRVKILEDWERAPFGRKIGCSSTLFNFPQRLCQRKETFFCTKPRFCNEEARVANYWKFWDS